MVGGEVLQVRHDEFGLVVHCVDGPDECAMRVDPSGEHPFVGDTVWWQGTWAMLNSPVRGYCDRKLKRIGFSFDPNFEDSNNG